MTGANPQVLSSVLRMKNLFNGTHRQLTTRNVITQT